VWIKAVRANQELMVRHAPDRFFVPPYVGPSGWVGVYLDTSKTDWKELAELIEDAWRMSTPKKLLASLDAPRPARPVRPERPRRPKARVARKR
jgi:hypothetical protein